MVQGSSSHSHGKEQWVHDQQGKKKTQQQSKQQEQGVQQGFKAARDWVSVVKGSMLQEHSTIVHNNGGAKAQELSKNTPQCSPEREQAIVIQSSHHVGSWNHLSKDISTRFSLASDFDVFPFEERKAFFFTSLEHKNILLNLSDFPCLFLYGYFVSYGFQNSLSECERVLDSLVGNYSIALRCQMLDSNFEWVFTGIYAPNANNTSDLKLFWREIEAVRRYCTLPWVIEGEFNEIRFSHERSSRGENSAGMRRFNNFISKHELIDLPLIGATFPWANNQIQSIRSRLDRILISLDWELQFPRVLQQALSRPFSDHNPIALICEGGAGFSICKKLQLLKPILKLWSKQEFGEMDRRIEELEDIFVPLDAEENASNGLTEEQRNTRLQARKEYCSLTILKVEKWRITEEMRVNLEAEVTEEEYLSYMKRIGQSKAPGPNGFPVSFYVLCWYILKNDIMAVFKELQEKNFLDWRLKNTFIALIPKKGTIEEIKDLRPISLVHGIYKIISKVLADRFKEVLSDIISSHQTTFIKKRQILDGVLVANELIDSRERSGRECILIKVDFEKAFDHVNWDFLNEILGLMSFGDSWRKWVNNLRLILLSFEQLTSLKINFAKSKNFGVAFDGDLSQFSSILGFYSGVLPTTYLGLPLGDRSGGVAKWDKVVDSFVRRLPASVDKKLERIMRNYLWSDNKGKNKVHLVKWPTLNKRRKFGGLSIKSLQKMNKALLNKWHWRFAKEKEVLWSKVVNIGCTGRYSRSHVKFKVNSGKRISFWMDQWLFDVPLSLKFPNLYTISRAKTKCISDVYMEESQTWNLMLPRRLNNVRRNELDELQRCLTKVSINTEADDEIGWNIEKKNLSTVKSIYDSFLQDSVD
ncbi:uncharacterized protein LOC113352514 [Papaver somniferum]|uniref:uncharacterized protein LOC113352514 n=1 Tax=Papaver somniferum TaxID=3469 RepID=UPI000E6F85A1|nr:uncharacterized protein LOC113352514 [Papaver somniferum]